MLGTRKLFRGVVWFCVPSVLVFFTASYTHAASYQKVDGTITDPITTVSGGILNYSGPNLEPGADLTNANLREALLYSADLVGANLTGADLFGAALWNGSCGTEGSNCFYEHGVNPSNLTGANLADANLTGVRLWGANLSNANLTGANLSWAELYSVNLSNAVIQDVQADSGDYVELWYSNLTGVNLANHDFSRWVLMGNTFTNADLTNADLSYNTFGEKTILINTNLTGAVLTGNYFDEATFSLGTILPNGQTVSEMGLDPVELGNYLTVDLGAYQADSLIIVPEPPDVSAADYNDDGIVDAADYTVWRDRIGGPVPPGYGGDADRNGLIDYRDYQFWKDHFGNGPATTTSSNTRVPEPTGLLLILMTLLGTPLRRAV